MRYRPGFPGAVDAPPRGMGHHSGVFAVEEAHRAQVSPVAVLSRMVAGGSESLEKSRYRPLRSGSGAIETKKRSGNSIAAPVSAPQRSGFIWV